MFQIKQLEWRLGYSDSEVSILQADAIGGVYQIRMLRSGAVWLDHDGNQTHQFPTDDYAKAAAQADFDRRIREWIEPSPAPDGNAQVVEERAPLSCRLNGPVDIRDASVIDALEAHAVHIERQIEQLADFIIAEVPGEPSQSEGAVDTAIRWMRNALASAEASRSPAVTMEEVARVLEMADVYIAGVSSITGERPHVLEKIGDLLSRITKEPSDGTE